MQIIGLKEIDYRLLVDEEIFQGDILYKDDTLEWNISTKPKNEFLEFNVILPKREITESLEHKKTKAFQRFCQCIQFTTHYLLNDLCAKSKSFNLTFYEVNQNIVVKIIPRNPKDEARITPLLLGYGLSMVPHDIHETIEQVKRLYLPFPF